MRFGTDKDAAAAMPANLWKRIEQEKAGLHSPTAAQTARPLTAHLDEWKRSLTAGGRGTQYIAEKVERVRTAVAGCGFAFPHDFTAFWGIAWTVAGTRAVLNRPARTNGLSVHEVRAEVERLMNWCSAELAAVPIGAQPAEPDEAVTVPEPVPEGVYEIPVGYTAGEKNRTLTFDVTARADEEKCA